MYCYGLKLKLLLFLQGLGLLVNLVEASAKNRMEIMKMELQYKPVVAMEPDGGNSVVEAFVNVSYVKIWNNLSFLPLGKERCCNHNRICLSVNT